MDDDELDALMERDALMDMDDDELELMHSLWPYLCECTRCGPPLAGGGRRCPTTLVPLFALMSYNADGRIICPSCRVHSFFKPFKCYACRIATDSALTDTQRHSIVDDAARTGSQLLTTLPEQR